MEELKSILLRRQSEKAACYIILTLGLSVKDNTRETAKRSVFARDGAGGVEEMHRQSAEDF